MSDKINYLKYKFGHDDFNETLGELIYQISFNPNITPVSIDKLKVYAYAIVYRSSVGVFTNVELCKEFERKSPNEQFLILQNVDTEELFGLLIPPLNGETYASYIFASRDYCFPVIKKANLDNEGEGFILINNEDINHFVKIFEIDEKNEWTLDELMPEHFLDFSKACKIVRKKGKSPSYDQMVEIYNKM